MNRKLQKLTSALLLLLCLLLTGCDVQEFVPSEGTKVTSELKVHFIDVGQADSILIQNNSQTALLDTGNRDDYDTIHDYLEELSIKSIDYLILTHPHEDHIGSAAKIIENFDIGTVYMTNMSANTKIYSSLMHAMKQKKLKKQIPKLGDTFNVGDCEFTFLGPVKKYEDPNQMSLVTRAVFGNKSFLFTGDAEIEAEKDMLNANVTLNSDVLKVGHHGSQTSSSYVFLKEVNPVDAVISSEKGNDYGHPHKKTLSRLNDVGATIYRTDKSGTIIATCDGKEINWNVIGTKSNQEHISKGQGLSTDKKNSSRKSNKVTDTNQVTYNTYVGNKNSKKFHIPDCSSLPAKKNQVIFNSREEAIEQEYEPCGVCNP